MLVFILKIWVNLEYNRAPFYFFVGASGSQAQMTSHTLRLTFCIAVVRAHHHVSPKPVGLFDCYAQNERSISLVCHTQLEG